MTTFGNTTEDDEGLLKPIDRGPPSEDRRTLDELRGTMREVAKAQMTTGERATVQGVATEIQVLKQQLEMTHEQMRRLIGMYQTLSAEFEQFKGQRIRELGVRVNGGSTTPEDIDGVNARPSH